MKPTSKDFWMFVTGVVGRSMQSGQFTSPDSIADLTKQAVSAFKEQFGEPVDEAHIAVSPPQARPTFAKASAPAGGGEAVMPESKPISVWGADKAYLGKKDWQFEGTPMPDVLWGTWLQAASEGNEKALKTLKLAAERDAGDPMDKWYGANCKRIARAKAILNMVANGYKASAIPANSDEPTPF
jgi:hypothetical protein